MVARATELQMTVSRKTQYLSIRRRLIEEQRAAISAAAEIDGLPSEPIIRRIADYERALVAVELMIDQLTP
jgi:hypothetical protein